MSKVVKLKRPGGDPSPRKRGERKGAPPVLVTSLPVSPGGPGLLAAETVVARGGEAVLDIVTSAHVTILGWCCYARDRASQDWFVVEGTPAERGRFPIRVPGAGVRVWGFYRFARGILEENVWRVYAENLDGDGSGRDVCLRLVVATGAAARVVRFPRTLGKKLRGRIRRLSAGTGV